MLQVKDNWFMLNTKAATANQIKSPFSLSPKYITNSAPVCQSSNNPEHYALTADIVDDLSIYTTTQMC